MTIDKVDKQQSQSYEKPQLTVQNELQKDVLKQTMNPDGLQKQLLQVLANQQPLQQIQQTAQNQIAKGTLNVKV
jgi:hypothetical protein